MRAGEYGAALEGALRDISPSAPGGTPLFRAAREALEMADAYVRDGRTFLASGDLVNGIAAFAYASGWLEASAFLGLLTPAAVHDLPTFSCEEPLMPAARLREKKDRYRRMLSAALEVVECSPDPGSPLFSAATTVLGRATALLGDGDLRAGEGREADSLACYSRGHGWLDAGVRAGLFRILRSRELFTVGPL